MAALGDDLICNFKKCRKRLKNFAWATSCSRILLLYVVSTVHWEQAGSRLKLPYFFLNKHLDVFCDEDGAKLFNSRTVCPACETDLPGKYDIVRVDLQPSEDYKSVSVNYVV